MAGNLLYLSVILNDAIWKEKAVVFLKSLSELIIKYPTSFGNWACLLIDVFAGINEIAICGKGFESLRNGLLTYFVPNKVLQCTDNPEVVAYPLFIHKPVSDKPIIYLCRNYTCQVPVENIETIVSMIDKSLNFN